MTDRLAKNLSTPDPPMYHIETADRLRISAICHLERSNFADPWMPFDISEYIYDKYNDIIQDEIGLRKEDVFSGLVALHNQATIGYLFFEYHRTDNYVKLTNLCIDETHRRQGVASQLLTTLQLGSKRMQPTMAALVRETNLPAQMLLKRNGFRWVATLKSCYSSSNESGYLMAFSFKHNDIASNHIDDKIIESY